MRNDKITGEESGIARCGSLFVLGLVYSISGGFDGKAFMRGGSFPFALIV
ncbi:hypothetical protein [Bartonella raoultii]|nr:hypothetical protein [Bartonella raoultii]